MQMLPGLCLLIGIVFQNESPRWLVEKNRIEDARKALARVRSRAIDDPLVTQELDEIVEDFNGHEKMPLAAQAKVVFTNRKVFYTFAMAVVLMFWQQWTGTNSINYYSPQIFKSVGLSGTSAGLFATGIYGVVKVVCTSLGLMFATEQLGRKWSLIIGGTGQAFAMIYIGEYSPNQLERNISLTQDRCQRGGQPSSTWCSAQRQQHIRHHLRVPLCGLL